ncbi:hypothetical protein ALMP_67480 [Streptomyces sp. A012304]|nr:hypothetical protein ALMP_67480 [Streptomyces sp. A012304]
MDEFGPLNLMPHPGRQWAERSGKHKDHDREPRRRRRATYNRYGGVQHLFAALYLTKDKLYCHIKPVKKRTQFLEFCRYLRSLYPPQIRIALVCDNFSPHLTTKRCQRVGTWAAANNVEIAYTPTSSSWPNRIEAQFTALRYFTLDGTDHASHKEQGSMIRRSKAARNGRGIIWELPGFRTVDALASAILTAAAPKRLAVYDQRVQHALDTLGLPLTPAPGRYGRYIQLLDDLLHHGGAHANGWTARDIDTALYWTGRPTPTTSR